MRAPLAELEGRRFDVAVIGAGANGASAAQHLAGAGYSVLLVDKGDYCSGSSSRSSRLLHCGLRYLAPGGSLWDFALHPSRLKTALTMAREAMLCRRQLVQTAPERVLPMTFHFPIWRDGVYRAWQVDLALRILASLAPRDVPLDHRRLSPDEARRTPLVNALRDMDKLVGVAAFREYQFEWPERICMDAVLDAERLGATVRNYTAATRLAREGDAWRIGLADALDRSLGGGHRHRRAQHGGHLDRPRQPGRRRECKPQDHRHQRRAHHGAAAAGMRGQRGRDPQPPR